MTDNYVFSLDLRPGYAAFFIDEPVTVQPLSLESAFRQAKDMYFTWCGRYMGNLIVYLLFLLPHWLYTILAACIFCLYILLLQILIFGRAWKENLTASWLLALAAMVWIGSPAFGDTFVWLSVGGQMALLGQALAFLPCRFALDAPIQLKNPFLLIAACMALFAGGILVSTLDFATSAALPVTCAACACWIWLKGEGKKKHAPWLLLAESCGLAIGAWLTISAPGNACRLALTADPSVHAWLKASLMGRLGIWLEHLPGSFLDLWFPILFLLIACLGLYRGYKASFLEKVPIASWFYLLPVCLTYGAYLFTAFPTKRAFATVAIQLLLAAAIIYVKGSRFIPINIRRILKGALIFASVASICHESIVFWNLRDVIEERIAIMEANRGGVAELEPLPIKGDKYQVLGWSQPDAQPDPNYWANRQLALYYDLKEVKIVPKTGQSGEESAPQRVFAPQTLVFSSSEQASGKLPQTRFEHNRIFASMPNTASASLHYYYHGHPGILAMFPDFLAEKTLDWLGSAREGEWRMNLVPLLMARVDVDLSSAPSGQAQGKSIFFKPETDKYFWLVKPGENKFSFNLLPLQDKSANDERME